MAEKQFIVAAALEGAGWHPAAWREPSSQPHRLFTPEYWVERTREAEAGGLDFVTFDDTLALQTASGREPDERVDEVRGRLDARLIATRVAPETDRIGLIPVVNTTLTEPFHQSKAIATLDFVSHGRAGFQPRVASNPEEYAHVGSPAFGDVDALFTRAADEVRTIRLLWDSWEDGAEIRDAETDRFIDADLLHTVDFVSETFTVRGPSITPRPPQGQPVVAVLAHIEPVYRLAAAEADLVFVTPTAQNAEAVLHEVRDAERRVGHSGERLRVVADLVVALDQTEETGGVPGESASRRVSRLDALGRSLSQATEARIVAGSAADVADVVEELHRVGYDGVRLRPVVLTDDLPRIAADLVPELRRRGLARAAYPEDSTLRGLVGLPTDVPNHFAGRRGENSPAPASAL
jgi:alkanesulfonate monooxygenase SsuD/methylene tetrahydromethanopterin reductase-like flavin-dependent oxidoreductase (luciferase family)